MANKTSVIIVAGGQGQRMGISLPKQFLLLDGVPIIVHTILAFMKVLEGAQIILVLPENHLEQWASLVQNDKRLEAIEVVPGGKERANSVKNGLEKITHNGIVMVHDGVRCLVSPTLINACLSSAFKMGSAVPVVKLSDSVRLVDDQYSEPVDRSVLRLVQTPQCFRVDELKAAFQRKDFETFTDEASLFEAGGHQVHLIDGERRNIKITTPEDLYIAQVFLTHHDEK